MTDSDKLISLAKEKGFKLMKLAEVCGLTYQGFTNKVKNLTEFTAGEILAISDLLELGKDDMMQIFFCEK